MRTSTDRLAAPFPLVRIIHTPEPTLVATDASNFCSVVQRLTGQKRTSICDDDGAVISRRRKKSARIDATLNSDALSSGESSSSSDFSSPDQISLDSRACKLRDQIPSLCIQHFSYLKPFANIDDGLHCSGALVAKEGLRETCEADPAEYFLEESHVTSYLPVQEDTNRGSCDISLLSSKMTGENNEVLPSANEVNAVGGSSAPGKQLRVRPTASAPEGTTSLHFFVSLEPLPSPIESFHDDLDALLEISPPSCTFQDLTMFPPLLASAESYNHVFR